MLNAGEGGFLIRSLQEMAIGSNVNVTVLFPHNFQLAALEVVAEIVRKEKREKDQVGVKYGLRIVHISEVNRMKLRYVLAFSHSIQG